MFEELEIYKRKGNFLFQLNDSFKDRCNAPTDCSGVYTIYRIVDNKEELIYIGSSGQRTKEGKIKHRKGGIYDRLVNGYHPNRFGEQKRIKRAKAFPIHMLNENIMIIRIYWWVTYDNSYSDFPTDVEAQLTTQYRNTFEKLPDWHQNSL